MNGYLRLISLIFSVLLAQQSWAYMDSVKKPYPIQRLFAHEKIDKEQRDLDKTDGKIDGIIKATQQDDINLYITDAMIRQINDLQDSVETNVKIKGQQQKVLYLNYIEQLVKIYKDGMKQKLVDPVIAPTLVSTFNKAMLATADSVSMINIINEAPYDVAKIVTQIINENIGSRESKNVVFLKFASLYPDKIVSNIEPFAKEAFADSLLVVGGKANPTSIYNFAQAANTTTGKLIHQSKNSMVQKLVELSKTTNALMYFPFLDDIINSKKSIDSLKKIIGNGEVGYDSVAYYKTLVKTEITYYNRLLKGDTPVAMFGANGLRETLAKKANQHFVKVINDLHNSSEAVRMRAVEPLSSVDLYYMLVLGEAEIYTSSYKHSFTRMLQRLGKPAKTDSLLEVVQYDYFKRFIKMAANYNRLDTFLKLMPTAKSEQVMHRFVDNLDKTKDLEDAVDVADSYSSISNKKLQQTILQYVKENETDAINNSNSRGKIIYSLLKTIFLSTDSTNKVNLTTEYGIPNIYTIENKQIANDSGRIVEQVFFYGDDDGKAFFPRFVNSFTDKSIWQITPKAEWVEIKSLKGNKVSIYVNRPLDSDKNLDDSAQAHLNSYLSQQGLTPSIIVHRGHSYWLPGTLKRMPDDVKIIVLGSCGGYKNLSTILKNSPNAHIISTKEIGVGDINRPILNYLHQNFQSSKVLDWRTMWATLHKTFSKDPSKAVRESWENYIPPYKNLGAIFIKAYNRKVAE
ncbi:MAG: hypothetical protein KA319_07500 [Ferruginibacter sp.]|nr:hypothetical protein [Ferruginibacter sp.]